MFSIFFLVGFAVLLGLGLAILVTRTSGRPSEPMIPAEEDFDQDPKTEKALDFEDLYKLARQMIKANGLVVKDELVQDDDEIYWVAESQNDFFFGNYVIGFFKASEETPLVGLTKILEFKDFIKSVGSTKGLFFTTGYFSRDVHQPLEGPKVSLYNRLKVLNELKKHQLS
jgi:hypothetical protein